MMRAKLQPIASLLLAVAMLLAGNGLQFTLLPLRGSADGFSAVALGAISSAYYVGFVSGCLLAPYLILRAGHIRAFAATVAVATAVALGYALAPDPIAWTMLRLITGFCLAGFYLVIESWLNDGTTNESRGLVMSAYVVVNFAALAVGQMLVTLYPIGAGGGFMIAAMLSSLAIVPVAMTRSAQPAPITIVSFRPMQLYQAAPVALVASFMVGIANGAFWGLAPLSAAGSGLGVEGVALFMSIAVVAGALTQWPLGRMSDRMDRRLVLLASLIGASVTGLVLWLIAASTTMLLTFGFLFGALALPGYSLAAAHGYDKTPASDMVATAATILLANALGSVIGPLAASAVMSGVGPRGLFLFTAIVQAALAGYVFYRTRVQASLAAPDKTGFDLATTAQVGTVVTSEALDPADPSVAVPEAYTPPPAMNDATDLVPIPEDREAPR
ncbi:MAG: MFS transporter [Betaproteobacteria bacterium]|nr:MFS transporter [Betaproteobacteria bacterium]